jgi:hypothetical protein
MPTTPVERLQTPLRKLRVILGEFGQPLSQEEFAKHSGLSLATVRGIENQRRSLSESCLAAIKGRLFAVWNPRDEEWHLLNEYGPLYTKLNAEKADTFPPKDPYLQDLMIHCLLERLLSVCKAIPHEQLVGHVMFLSKLLGDHAKEFELPVDLEGTEPVWHLIKKPTPWKRAPMQEVALVAKYRGHLQEDAIPPQRDDDGIYDFRAHRSFNPEDYPAKDWHETKALEQDATPRTAENSGTLVAPRRKRTKKSIRKTS